MGKKILPYILAIVAFIIAGYAYAPYTLSGKVVNQSDISSWKGMSHEIVEWNEAHPNDPTYWTNSMFSGMPATTISVIYHGDITKYLYDVLFVGQRPASYLIICMIGAFLMFLAFGVNVWLAILGAIGVAFCSYNMQIIQVGHNTKMVAIAFMPWVIASLVYAYRKNWLLGAAFFGLALSFQIKANHPQITYYLALIVLGFAVWRFCKAFKEKAWGKFLKTSAAVLVAGLLGIAANTNHLWPTYEYGQHTMRGGTELSAGADKGADNAKSGKKTRSGLDLEYATQWSYGIEETPNLFIPDFNGGASAGALSSSSAVYKTLTRQYNYPPIQAQQAVQNLPLYWGPQAFTAGPMYMGAVFIFLCVLGLFVVKGGVKWWLAGVSLLAVILAWGYHFMAPTEFFFNYAPMYNKFRTVSMILVILQVTIPILGILAVNKVVNTETDKKKTTKQLMWAAGICGGFALLFGLIPSLAGNFSSSIDSQLPKEIAQALQSDRSSLLRADAFRSLAFVLIAALLVYLALNKKMKKGWFYASMILLVLIDMWPIDKRYLSEKDFVTDMEFDAPLAKRDVDEFILEDDKDPDYRVFDLTIDPFNNAYVSHHHKTIGGYSPAKLQRYQDLIDRHIRREHSDLIREMQGISSLEDANAALTYHPVLSMLNTRYFILSPDTYPLANPHAQGNCWFVDNIVEANTADEEINLLGAIDPRRQAIVAKDFIAENPGLKDIRRGEGAKMDSTKATSVANDFASISLMNYAPNKLTYRYSSATPQAAIFSEVYYPGWKAVLKTDDGKETELKIFRANWILRGLLLPQGSGEITFTFQPESFIKGEKYSLIASGLLILLLIAAIIFSLRKKKEEA
ncbi:MAG: hypothetical protein J6T04_08140 [Bacteroidales bacterium]|nr:hypothetical protein [Bacteroidales bacterium]